MGEVFAGRYELADPIGRGGVGAVWRAWDHRRRRYVAAKVLQQRDAHSLLRFVREQALRIDHPHVLAPASWAADDDKVLFTMDLVAGGSLVHLVGDYGPLPPAFVCTLLDQLLSGLAAVHAEGVVHRDIKPANVLLEATGTARPRLRLSDFGIAMRLGEPRLTETNLVVGTPGYLAPEQMLGAEPDFPADLFAVGLVALYLLEGAKPDAKALVQYFTEHGTPGAPKGIPEPLWQVVAMLLQPDPEARFRTATGARKALAAAAELLPEPGPDDELIEIFDQLGPLPKGFAPEGPLKPFRKPTPSADPGGGPPPPRPDTDPGSGGPAMPFDAGRRGAAAGPGAGAAVSSSAGGLLPARPSTPPFPAHPGTPSLPARPGAAPGQAVTGSLPGMPGTPPHPSRPGTDPLPAQPTTPPPLSVTGPGETSPHTPSAPASAHHGTGPLPAQPAASPHPAPPATAPHPAWPGTGSVPSAAGGGGFVAAHPGAGVVPQTADRHHEPHSAPSTPRLPAHPPTVTPTPTPTPTPSMSDTGSFHLPPPLPTVTATPPPTPTPTPTPTPQSYLSPAPYDPTFALAAARGPHGEAATASYTAQDPVAAAPRRRGHRAVRRSRPGPPAKVAVPLLLLALACYAVGFWALARI
ncbi:protein kinase [Streptomyces sp. NPDC096132]|uniref:serine/threonine-protein kinase n=1 Tax=Streptomyces sp. NPDC096132 TaxID=3366075 RepID=UPI0038015CAF